MWWYGLDLAEDRALCEHGNETSHSIKCWEVLK
jgi:hypothetical protein